MYSSSVAGTIPIVRSFREHIDDSICSHKVGTSEVKSWIIFTDGNKQIIRDEAGVYHYKGYKFEIRNGVFSMNDLKFKLPQRTEISIFQRIVLSLGYVISLEDGDPRINVQKLSFRDLLHGLTMLALKDHKIISNQFKLDRQMAYGRNIFEAYLAVISGSGRLRANKGSIRWLNEQDTLKLKSRLFDTSGYQVGVNSMKYTPTEFAEKIFGSVFDLMQQLEFVKNDIDLQSLDFAVPASLLEVIRLRDVMMLLNVCIGYNNGFIIRPELTDLQNSRVYSAFTSISSETRKALGFNNYDIGAALQTICLQLVKDPSCYPIHQELVNDKKAFRAKIQLETGQDLAWVKTELSKIDNLDNMPKRYNHYPILKAYYNESQVLRREIINTAEPHILSRAKEFAKPNWKKIWIADRKKPEFVVSGQKESSIFFFIWTQWERQIRESMMSCFDEPEACHQVHDAVYSKQIINPRIIEEKVLQDTGFKVQISTD